jgi:hypothetical protein
MLFKMPFYVIILSYFVHLQVEDKIRGQFYKRSLNTEQSRYIGRHNCFYSSEHSKMFLKVPVYVEIDIMDLILQSISF